MTKTGLGGAHADLRTHCSGTLCSLHPLWGLGPSVSALAHSAAFSADCESTSAPRGIHYGTCACRDRRLVPSGYGEMDHAPPALDCRRPPLHWASSGTHSFPQASSCNLRARSRIPMATPEPVLRHAPLASSPPRASASDAAAWPISSSHPPRVLSPLHRISRTS